MNKQIKKVAIARRPGAFWGVEHIELGKGEAFAVTYRKLFSNKKVTTFFEERGSRTIAA
jgi:hypothetical protein